jgi:opacity protein-like surface antigen
MKRSTATVLAATIAGLLAAAPAGAQYLFLGGGLTIPTGEFKDDQAKSGWIATGGVGFDIGTRGLWAELQGYFGKNSYKGTGGDNLQTLQGMAALGYSFTPGKSVSPWVMAGAGFLNHKYKPGTTGTPGDSETKFAWQTGAGLTFKAGSKSHVWVGGQYTSSSYVHTIGLLAGLSIAVGGN